MHVSVHRNHSGATALDSTQMSGNRTEESQLIKIQFLSHWRARVRRKGRQFVISAVSQMAFPNKVQATAKFSYKVKEFEPIHVYLLLRELQNSYQIPLDKVLHFKIIIWQKSEICKAKAGSQPEQKIMIWLLKLRRTNQTSKEMYTRLAYTVVTAGTESQSPFAPVFYTWGSGRQSL